MMTANLAQEDLAALGRIALASTGVPELVARAIIRLSGRL